MNFCGLPLGRGPGTGNKPKYARLWKFFAVDKKFLVSGFSFTVKDIF